MNPDIQKTVRQRSELLARLIERGSVPPSEQIPRLPMGTPAPLSFGQERLWFVEQLGRTGAAYNVPLSVTLRGALDVRALETALGQAVQHHEALRTTVDARHEAAVQVVSAAAPFHLAVDDFSALPEEARRAETAEARRPFDLGRDLPFRARLLRLAPEEHVLLLTVHHAAFDGVSAGLFLRELGALYGAARGRQPASLAEPRLQFGDFAAWQRRMLDGPERERQMTYWLERLAGAPMAPALPTDLPRPASQGYRGGRHRFSIPPELTRRVRALAAGAGATPYMVLLAALNVLVHRYSGEEDVVLGSVVSGRTRPALEGVIGFLASTVALRTDLSGSPRFGELLARVREGVLGALAHSDLPFELLVDGLRLPRSLSHTPLFQLLFSYQEEGAPPSFDGLDVAVREVDNGGAKFDLTLQVESRGQGMDGLLVYDADLFAAETVERMARHFLVLLDAAAANPELEIAEIPLLDAAERERVVREWNRAETSPAGETLHGLISAQAARTPDAVALTSGEESVTYAELERRANRLAHRLRALGVGPEVRVGVCAGRSPEMVVALLAVLKAGGAYVPIDPEYPAERVAFMLGDAGVAVLLADAHLRDALPVHGAEVLLLGSACEGDDTEPMARVEAEHPAYVIYTSGSTGRPKGVVVPHRGATALVRWAEERFTPAERAVVLASTSICFDLSVFEIFAPLATGGRVVLAENALALPEIRAAGQVTLLNTVPSAGAELLRGKGIPAGVRTACLAGEPLRPELAQALHAAGVEAVYNLYGPTECTVYATWSRVPAGAEAVRIGRPVDGTRAYVLDERGEPVPVGVPGELYLGGAGLARGYLGRPGLTAERFVPDALSGEPGARLYRTGDRVRWRSEGELEFMGRLDEQVKIRGFRIEPGEVEAALVAHPAVRQAVVLARIDAAGDPLLTAYLVAAPGAEIPEPHALRTFLKGTLPEHMVPTAWIRLDALPLTPSGKVDRRALPAPAAGPERAYVAPRGKVEEAIAAVWAGVLGVERIGAHDHFFDLGGHSLKAARVMGRLEDALGVALPLRAIFEAPTVAELAARVEARTTAAAERIPRLGAATAPLSSPQRGLWFLEQMDPGDPRYNMRQTFRIGGKLDAAALAGALGEIVSRHEALRTVFRSRGGEPVQVVLAPFPLPLAAEDLRALEPAAREAAIQRIGTEEVERPFDLAEGPLVRARLLRLDHEEHVLLLTLHHVIFDGWSAGVLFRELSALYDAFRRGEGSPLPPLPLQYPDYAAWQQGRRSGGEAARQLEYWKERLAGVPTVLELPTDRPRPAVQRFEGASRRMPLSAATVAKLHALGRREGTTPFMTLLAVFQTLLYRYTGQPDVVVGSPFANRPRPELEELIGFFVNTLVLRTELAGNPTFRELLGRVRDVTLGAYAHADVPFEELVDALGVERSLSHEPLFQVNFILQNAPEQEVSLPDVRFTRVNLDRRTTKFDLSLFFWEEEGGLLGWWEYNTALFDAETVERIAGHFQALLGEVLADPEVRVDTVSLLTPAERGQIVEEWNRTSRDYDTPPGARQVFEDQARRTPDAPALISGSVRLTYAELDRGANALAHRLAALGVGPDSLVGICVPRSHEMAVVLLAVLKAGGAAVALDPTYPRDRIEHIARDARMSVMVAHPELADALPDTGARRLLLDGKDTGDGRDDAPAVEVPPDALMYAIYTSGSTGLPKGIGVTQGAFANLLAWHREHEVLSPRARTAQFAAFGFCVSFQEFFTTWDAGGTVVVVEEEGRRNLEELVRVLRDEEVERLYLPFAALKHLAEIPWRDDQLPRTLREVVTAGEKLLVTASVRGFLQRLGASLHNQYGASETHVVCSLTLQGGPDAWPYIPSVGRAVPNARVYVLDGALQPVPVGVPGEVCVGGEQLPRGYLNSPSLTAEKLIPDPFGAIAGGRLYRTGDLARLRPDGSVDVLGRIDHQVKIRGYRLELGEIEAVLRQHPAVRDVALMIHPVGGERRLVAYVVPAEGEGDTAALLRTELRRHLPEYMIPSVFVPMERLPINGNGKLDFVALPVPSTLDVAPEPDSAGPSTPLEAELAAIWGEVLGLEHVPVHADFFKLGGHSLIATQIVVRVRDALSVELSLRTLFEAPTVAELAEAVELLRAEGAASAPAPLVPSARRAGAAAQGDAR